MFGKRSITMKRITIAGFLTISLIAGYNIAVGGVVRFYSDWKAPKSAEKDPDPIPATAASVSAGHALFTQNCEACHGANGQGDGPTGAFLSPHPANLTTASFWKQGEGAIFWKITHGRSPMPSFRDSLTRKQRWDVINYIHQKFDPARRNKP